MTTVASEVRYERLRPEAIRQARTVCPVAYLPIGTLEWHGPHNPVGLDTLKAHGLAIRCAQAHGGLVLPPLWYGENRENALLESSCGLNAPIAQAYGLPDDSFDAGHMGRSIAEQDAMYHALLLHTMHQSASLGFRVLVVVAGHYPLLDHAKAAAHIFHQQTHHRRPERKTIVWGFCGYELLRDRYGFAGDHAAFWETSLMMALESGLVDKTALPGDPAQTLGVGGPRPAQEADATQGEEFVRAIVERVGPKVAERLADPVRFMAHNLPF